MMNTTKLESWKKRFEEVNVFEEFEQIITILQQEYLAGEIPYIVNFSGGKDSSLVLTLLWQALLRIPPKKRKREVHVVMSDTVVETPVMTEYQRYILREVEQNAKKQGLECVHVHMVRPPMKSRFFFKLIGRGTPFPMANTNRFCTAHLKINPIQAKVEEIIKLSYAQVGDLQLQHETYAVVSLLGVRLDESQNRAQSIRKFELDDLYAQHALDNRILCMHPIKHIDLDSLWSYLESLPNGQFPYGGNVAEMMKQYGKTGMECGLKDGSEGEGLSCGKASSRSGCWTCGLVSGEDKMLAGLIEEGHPEYRYLQEFKDYMIAIRNDVRFRMPTQRVKFQKFFQIAQEEQESELTIFDNELSMNLAEKRRHLYETFGRAKWEYAPGALTIEARKRLLSYLLWTQQQVKRTLIEQDEINAILQTWEEDGYHVHPEDITPNRYRHVERLVLRKDGTINEKQTTVKSFPIYYVKIQTAMSESVFVTYIQNKVKETGDFIPYLSRALDEEDYLTVNEYIFIVCTPFASSEREAEHYVLSWLGWVDSFPFFKYDPPYEGWSEEEEVYYLPKTSSDQDALMKSVTAEFLMRSVHQNQITQKEIWVLAEWLDQLTLNEWYSTLRMIP